MNKFKISYFTLLSTLLISVFFYACKPHENSVKVKVKINHKPTKYLVQQLIDKEFQFTTLSGKAAVEYDDGEKKTSFKTNLRIRKDSAIWLSITPVLGIEMARVLITKDTVKVMNRIDNEYFIGDFEYLNKIFGADLDFQMLEALLIGNSLDFENNEKVKSSIDRKKNKYYLSTVKKRKIRKEIKKDKGKIKQQTQTIWLDPINYKINELLLSTPESDQSLTSIFSEFKKIDDESEQLFPHHLIFNLETKTPSSLEVNYSKLSIGKTLSFPFKIPSKYVQIKK